MRRPARGLVSIAIATTLAAATAPMSLTAVAAVAAAPAPPAAPAFDTSVAARFARLALDCVHREYPNKIAHVLNGDADVRAPRDLTPAFYGCYDSTGIRRCTATGSWSASPGPFRESRSRARRCRRSRRA